MDPPTRYGCSPRVRRRVRRGLAAARVAFDSLGVLREALRRQWGQQLERDRERWERESRAMAGREDRETITVTGLVYGIGEEIVRRAKALAEADEALDSARHHRREVSDRRARAKKDLYHELATFRRTARGILRPRLARRVGVLQGETERGPEGLLHQTDQTLAWARGRTGPTLQPLGHAAIDWAGIARPLEPLRDELAAAVRAFADAQAAAAQDLARRDQALAEFDRSYNKGCRLLERLYIVVGLPSLAAAVRPYRTVVGRVGRPAKKPSADDYPDLAGTARPSLH